MNPADSKLLKEKLEAVISTAEEFGRQSEQFKAAKKSIQHVIDSNNELREQLVRIAESTQAYMDTAKQLIDEGFTAQIMEDIQRVSSIIEQCEKQAKDVTAQYDSVMVSFKEHEDKLHLQQEEVLQQTNKGFSEAFAQLSAIKLLLNDAQDKNENIKSLITERLLENEKTLTVAIGVSTKQTGEHLLNEATTIKESVEKSFTAQQQSLGELNEKIVSHNESMGREVRQILQDLKVNHNDLVAKLKTMSDMIGEATKATADSLDKELSSIRSTIEGNAINHQATLVRIGDNLNSNDETIKGDLRSIIEALDINQENIQSRLDIATQKVSGKCDKMESKIDALNQLVYAYIQTEHERYDKAQKLSKQKLIVAVAGYAVLLVVVLLQFLL